MHVYAHNSVHTDSDVHADVTGQPQVSLLTFFLMHTSDWYIFNLFVSN